jgi:hypothetical protein
MITPEDRIIEALKSADDGAGEADTLHQVLADMAKNQSMFLRVYPWLVMCGALTVQFFGSDQPRQWALYATIFVCDMIVVAIVKLWLYLCWVRNSIMREIKRMELRLVAGSHSTAKPSGPA